MPGIAKKLALILVLSSSAQAGVFNLPHFVAPGDFAIGLEPELILSSGAGLGVNAKYTQGLNELMNFTGLIGTGSGPRRFRVGGNMVFDFFPDIENQPGIGIATQVTYYRLHDRLDLDSTSTFGRLEVQGIPYIHKTFVVGANEIEPFFAFPFGFGFADGRYKALANVAVGAMFKNTEKFRYVMEVGVAVNNTESYFSGGVVYYH